MTPASHHQRFPLLTHLAYLVTYFNTALPRPPAHLITSVCTLSVPVCLLSSAEWESQRRVQRNSSRWCWTIFCVCSGFILSSSERNLFVNLSNCRENSCNTFSYDEEFIPHLLWKVKGEKEMYTHCTGPTHYSHMPAIRGHTHVHAHPHTRVCPIQCAVGLNDCGMNFAEYLDLF